MGVGPLVEGESTDKKVFQGDHYAKSYQAMNGGSITLEAERGAKLRIKTFTVESAALSGATANIGTNSISAGWYVFGVTTIVTTLITASGGGASFKIGDGSDDDKWGAGIAFALGTQTTNANFTAGPSLYTANTNIVLTVNTGAFTAGKVRATIAYFDMTAPAT